MRQQVLRAGVRRGLLDQGDADEMGGWDHGGGFALDAAVRIEGADRAGRERLLRYCARPPVALEHLHEHHAGHLVYRCPKPRPGGPSALVLTPLELIDKIAALVPPPRTHRHRYYGVLAPNAPLRAAVTALAPAPVPPPPPADSAGAQQASAHRGAARYLWAMLRARIDEVLPLTGPFCHTPMRSIAFLTEPSTVRQILDHRGEATRPPRIAPARGPPLWEAAAASNVPAWDHAAAPAPDVEFDQRITHHLVRSNACLAWVRLGARCNERGMLGPDSTKSGRCAPGRGKMRSYLRTGRRNPALTGTARSGIPGLGPLKRLSFLWYHH